MIIWCLITSLSLIRAQGVSTDKSYYVDYGPTPLSDLFDKLEEDYGLLFSYSNAAVLNQVVSVRYNGKSTKQLLTKILADTPLGFEIVEDNYILISEKELITVCGRVVDDMGEALIGATVLVDNTSVGCATDLEGLFSLQHYFIKGQDILFSYIGYENKAIDYKVLANGDCPELVLSYPEIESPWLIITDYILDAVSLDNNGSATVLRPDKIGALPGQAEPDILKSVQFLPGISSPSSKSSDLYIRGGTPDQNLIMWEDIPIYHSAHYFGMISAFDPFTTKKMEIYRGGFGAEYGGRIAGVIDIEAQDEQTIAPKFRVGSNMTHSYLSGLLHFGESQKTALSYSVRRSFSELFESPTFKSITEFNQQGFILNNQEVSALNQKIEVTNDFAFTDSHLKLSSQLSDKDRIELAGIYASNDFNDEIIDVRRMEGQRDSLVLNNRGLSINWKHQWNSAFSSKVKLVGTDYNYTYEYKLKEVDKREPRISGNKENSIVDKQFSFSNIYKTQNQSLFHLGYHLINYDVSYLIDNNRPGRDIKPVQKAAKSNLHSFFMSYDKPQINTWGINVGLRVSAFDPSNDFYLEPRISSSYKLSQSFNLIANFGRYHQFVSQVVELRGNEGGLSLPIWALAENKNRPIQKADLYQLGIIYDQHDWLIDLQGYSRKVDGLSSQAYELDGIEPGNPEIGYSSSRGIDLLINRKFDRLSSWLSYSYSKSELNFKKIAKTSFPTDYDQRHVAQWSNQVNLSNIDLALGYKLSSGLPYSVIDNIRFENIQGGPDPTLPLQYSGVYDGRNNYVLPMMHELNFSAQYRFQDKNNAWKAYLSFSISNVLNTENIYNRTYYVDALQNEAPSIEIQDKKNLLFTPDLSFRIEW